METHGLQLLTFRHGVGGISITQHMITSVSDTVEWDRGSERRGLWYSIVEPGRGILPTSRQFIPPTLTVHPLDEGRIIAIVPTNRDRVILLETATMSQVLTIPAGKTSRFLPIALSSFAHHSKTGIAVHCFAEGGKEYLQLWDFLITKIRNGPRNKRAAICW
jgi:hypothetical protein